MSVGQLGKSTNLPREAIGMQIQAEFNSQYGELPGIIQDFNPENQTATIKPLYKPKHNGVPVQMPHLEEIPVRFMRGGDAAITFPVKPGDRVTLRPQMRSTENYHSNGEYVSTDARTFSLSDMEAFIDGGEPLSDPIANFDNKHLHIRFDDTGEYGIKGSKNGQIRIDGINGEILNLLSEALELLASDGLNISHGSSSGGGHQLQFKGEYGAIANKIRTMIL